MNDYSFSYSDDVTEGIKNVIVTNQNGKKLTVDEGIDLWCKEAKKVQDSGGLIFFLGNGASATMAEHMSHDWFQNAVINTQTCAETAHITAVSNDLSFENVFSYRINRIITKSDLIVAISSSGNSPNVIKAIKSAREKGAFIVTLTGMKEDNKARILGDMNFYVNLQTYGLVESAHSVFLHCTLDYFLDKYMGGRH